MRRHLTYANVAATLALVFAMTGGALAAKHYLINSTKQINPKVLKKLRGNAGARGATGAAGPAGKEGPAGKQGADGKAASVPETISISPGNVSFAAGKAAEAIAEVVLPTGTYTVLASTIAENTSAAPDKVNCTLLDPTDDFNLQEATVAAKGTARLAVPAMLFTVTTPSEKLSVACKSEDTAEGAFTSIRLIATKT